MEFGLNDADDDMMLIHPHLKIYLYAKVFFAIYCIFISIICNIYFFRLVTEP